MKHIPLTSGHCALVDDEDFDRVINYNKYAWFTARGGGKKKMLYAGNQTGRGGRSDYTLMHRLIMNSPKGMQVDHRDRNGLNNQKSNLRLCTHSQNLCNQGLSSANTSGFKGVSYHKQVKLWRSRINLKGKEVVLGYFHSAIEAAIRYDEMVGQYFGEFALTNRQLGLLT